MEVQDGETSVELLLLLLGLTVVVVLGQNQTYQRPAVLALGRGRRCSAAFHPAQLLRQAQESLAQNGASQPITAAFQRLWISARLQRESQQLGLEDIIYIYL